MGGWRLPRSSSRGQRVPAVTAVLLVVVAAVSIAAREGSDPPPPVRLAAPTPPTPSPTPTRTTEPSPDPTLEPAPAPTSRPAASRAPRPAATPRPAAPSAPAASAASITAAFYYGLYPGGFNAGTRQTPSEGRYDSEDPALVGRHVSAMRYAGMQAAIASWWGPDSQSDRALKVGLQAAAGTPFKWTIYYELEGPGQPNLPPHQLRSKLADIMQRHAQDPSYLRVDGKPVIFVWPDPDDRCEMVQRWKEANTMGFYVVQKVFPGSGTCAGLADSWHQYAPAHAKIEAKPWSYAVSAGFWHYAEPSPRLARDPDRYAADVRAMASSSAQWKLVTTFNEWGEGTAVESAQEWSTPSGYGRYLDILHATFGSR